MLLKANWKGWKIYRYNCPGVALLYHPLKTLHPKQEDLRKGKWDRNFPSKTTGEVTSKATNKYSVFTITNYDLYQSDDRQDDTGDRQRHSNDKRTTTIEERKKEIKKEDNIYSASGDRKQQASALYETLWKLYPHKKGKGQVSDTQKQKLLKGG